MKYWKKPNGDCGTVDDNGAVPDSISITEDEYNVYVANQPIISRIEPVEEFEDIDSGKVYRMRRVGVM